MQGARCRPPDRRSKSWRPSPPRLSGRRARTQRGRRSSGTWARFHRCDASQVFGRIGRGIAQPQACEEGAVSACSCGSKGKAQSPANSYPFHRSAFSTANGGAVILLIVRISPQVLPRKFPEIVFVHMSIGGRRPRIGCRRHRVVSAKLSDGLTATPGAKR